MNSPFVESEREYYVPKWVFISRLNVTDNQSRVTFRAISQSNFSIEVNVFDCMQTPKHLGRQGEGMSQRLLDLLL